MFLFQSQSAISTPAQKADKEAVDAFMGIVRAHANRAILFDLLRLPRETEAWRAELVMAAGGEKEYLPRLKELLSRAKELRMQLREHLPEAQVLGFFYGYELRLQFASQAIQGGAAKQQLDVTVLKGMLRKDMGTFIRESPVLAAAADGAALAVKLAYQSLSEPAPKEGKAPRADYKKSYKSTTGFDVGVGGSPAEGESGSWKPEDVNIFYSAPRTVSWSVPVYWTKVAPNVPGYAQFQSAIDAASAILGISRQGDTFSVPSNISGSAYLDYRNCLYSAFSLDNSKGWFNTEIYIGPDQKELVRDAVARDLLKGASIEQLAAALQTGDFQAARGMLVPGSNTYKAFGDQSSFKNGSSVFDEASMLRLLRFSASTGAGISYRFGESDQSPLIQVVATGTRDFLVTDQQIDNLALGAWTVFTVKPTKTKLRVGGGVQMSSGAKPSFYLVTGAEQNIPINRFLRVVLDGTAAATYAQSISQPIFSADLGVGLKAKIGNRVEVGIKSDFFLVGRNSEFFKGAKGAFTFDYTPANWAKIGVYGELYAPSSQKATVFTGEQQYVSQDWPGAVGLRLNFSPSGLFKKRPKGLGTGD